MIRPRHAAAASALLLTAILVPSAARADELDDTGVRVDVEFSPLECVSNCVPVTPGTPGGSPLPATGADFPILFLWLALVLIAAGIAFLAARRLRASPAAQQGTLPRGLYYVVSGRRAQQAHDALPSSSHTTASSRGVAGDRRVD